MSIAPSDILFYMGGAAWVKHGTPTRRVAMIGRGGEEAKETWTRSGSGAYQRTRTGLYLPASANIPRVEMVDLNGDGTYETPTLLGEATRTNVVLWNRDLTNAAWTKTNCTPLKDQTGVDGVANSASKITASAGNATCLQAIVLGSSARYQTAFLKMLFGSGTIQMTMDNGATWTTVTVTTDWTRVVIPTQTLANPTVGFRIVTSGNVLAVDLVQNENGNFPTNPIPVTTVAVARSDDRCTVPLYVPPQAMTVYAQFEERGTMGVDTATIMGITSGAVPRLLLWRPSGAGVYQFRHDTASTSVTSSTAAVPTRGQKNELRGVLFSDGSVQINQSIAGATETNGTQSAANTLASAWSESVLGFNKDDDGVAGCCALIALIGVRGAPSLTDLRALLPSFA